MNAVDRFPDEYQAFTKSTAVYPQHTLAIGLSYVTLGLIDELGELFSAVDSGKDSDIIAEAGDVCWYTARICDHLDMQMSSIFNSNITYDGAASLHDAVTKAMVYAAIAAGRVKKIIRDGHLWNDEQRAKVERMIFDALRGMVSCVGVVVRFADSNFIDVMKKNMDKLSSRKERGVLQGDGDNR
jgi:NTP pyrophosphatase (non-canonical NTP hydrolase)